MAYVCKWLQRQLAAELPAALALTAPLRHAPAGHVRRFAADAVAFLFRAATAAAVPAGVEALVAEVAAARTAADAAASAAGGAATVRRGDAADAAAAAEAAADAAGALLAAAMRGTGHALHSRAPRLLSLLLPPDGGAASPALSAARFEALRRACDAMWNPLRRGGCAPLWDALLAEGSAASAVSTAQAATATSSTAAALRLQRVLQLLAAGVEHRRGARVEDYGPLLDFCDAALAGGAVSAPAAAAAAAELARLMAALLAGHCAVAGASAGPAAGAAAALRWADTMAKAPLPALPQPAARRLASALLAPGRCPAGARTALCGTLCAALAPAAVRSRADNAAAALLAGDLCDSADPGAASGLLARSAVWRSSLALQLRAWLDVARGDGGGFACTPEGAAAGAAAAGEAWAALRLLPHACADAASAVDAARLASDVADTAAAAAAAAGRAAAEPGAPSAAAAAPRRLGGVQAAALACARRALASRAPAALPAAAAAALRHAAELSSAPLLHAAADACDAALAAGSLGPPPAGVAEALGGASPPDLSTRALLTEWLPRLEALLASPRSAVRHGALRLLAHFEPPPLLPPPGGNTAASADPAPMLAEWAEISAPLGSRNALDAGRHAAVLLGNQARLLRAGRVPPSLAVPLARCLVGGLRTRLALLWPPAQAALGAALEAYPEAVLPVILTHLEDVQRELLDDTPLTSAAAVPARSPSADADVAVDLDRACARELESRFSGEAASPAHVDGCDSATLHGLLLRALTRSPGPLAAASRGMGAALAPLLLAYCAPRGPAAGAAAGEPRGGRRYRTGLRDWLALFGALDGGRGFGDALKAPLRLLFERLLSDADPGVQRAAIACLRAHRLPHLPSPLADALCRFAAPTTLRAELTGFALARGAPGAILPPEHRQGFVPLLIAVLFPKLRTRRGARGGGPRSGAPGAGRAAVLSFLAGLDADELAPLLHHFIVPFAPALGGAAGVARAVAPRAGPDALLGSYDAAALALVPLRRRVGFLHAAADVIDRLGDHAGAYWHALIGLTAALLAGALDAEPGAAVMTAEADDDVADEDEAPPDLAGGADVAPGGVSDDEEDEEVEAAVVDGQPDGLDGAAAKAAAAPKAAAGDDDDDMDEDEDDDDVARRGGAAGVSSAEGARETRGLALRVLASALCRRPDPAPWAPYWPVLAAAAMRLGPRLPDEAAASPAPPALELAAALAADATLAPRLGDSNAALLHGALGALASPRASPAVRSAALGVCEGLLAAGTDGIALLRPRAPRLLAALRASLLRAAPAGAAPRAAAAATAAAAAGAGRELALLEALAPHCASGAAAAHLAAALLPVLSAGGTKGRRAPPEGAAARVLRCLSALFSPADATQKLHPALLAAAPRAASASAPLLASLAPNGEARTALLGLLAALAPHHAPSAAAVPHLRALNALEAAGGAAGGLEERAASRRVAIDASPDYEARLKAYRALCTVAPVQDATSASSTFGSLLAAGAAPPLLWQCLADLRSDDLALRTSSASALSAFLAAAAAAEPHLRDAASAMPPGGAPPGGGAALIATILLPAVRRVLRGGDAAVRREHVALLGSIAAACPGAVPQLASLRGAEAEADVFYNLGHIQAHRRARALRRLAAAAAAPVEAGGLGAAAAAAYAVPLAEAALGEAATAPELGEAAAEALGAAAGGLAWGDYHATLRRRLLAAAARPEAARLEARAAAHILSSFHFWETGDDGARVLPERVRAALVGSVVPMLARLVVVPDGLPGAGGVRSAAALAAVRALKLLPPDAAAAAAPSLLGGAVACLRSRAGGVRDGARAALAAASAELGPGALPYLTGLLSTSLRQGFQRHVLGFTLHAMLAAAAGASPTTGPRAGDDRAAFGLALEAAAPLLRDDIFGEAGAEREERAAAGGVGGSAGGREGRRCRSYESLELLAQRAPFPASAEALLGCVTPHLAAAAASAGVRARAEAALAGLARGLARNSVAPPAALLAFVHATLDDGLRAEAAAAAAVRKLQSAPATGVSLGAAQHAARPGEASSDDEGDSDADADDDVAVADGDADEDLGDEEDAEDEGAPPPNFELLMAFALHLLRLFLKAGGAREAKPDANGDNGTAEAELALEADDDDDEAEDAEVGAAPGRRALLEGMVPVLARCVRSRHVASAEGSLRCLAALAPLRLSQLRAAAPALAKRLHAALRRGDARPGAPLPAAALRLWGALLRAAPDFQPTPPQLRFLLGFAFADLMAPETAGASFSLLRAILARKPLLPEIYDLMTQVGAAMVRAHSAQVRSLAAHAFVQYLLDYPLGPRRLSAHLEFILANLAYEHASGREASVGALAALVARLPRDELDAQAAYFLLPLTARMASDPAASVRSAAAATLKALLARCGEAAAAAAVTAAAAWLGGERGALRGAGAQLLGLASEAVPARLAAAWRTAIVPPLRTALLAAAASDAEAAAAAVAGGGDVAFEAEGAPGFDGEAPGGLAELRLAAPGWREAYHCLALVEKVHARQRALLAGGGAENDALWAAAAGPALLTHAHAWVRAAAARLLGAYCAAGTTPTDPGFAAPPLLAGRGLRAAARATVAALAAGGQDEAAEAQCVKNLVCLAAAAMHRAAEEAARHAAPAAADAGADGDESASDDDDGSDADAEEEGDRGDGRFCEWLLRRVSGLGSPGQPEALRLAVLRWAAGCASRAGGALAGAHASSLLRPAYQAAEGAAENTGEAVRALAAEAVEVLRAVMPPGVFASAYAAQRERAAARRADRRAQRAVEAVADPAAAARRRAARAAKKRTAGAAKAQERRMHRERGTLPADVEARRAAKKARTGGRD